MSTMNTLDERQGVTTISANARIDYIFRFTKQAVLVIDDEPEVFTNVGNEFIGSLSKEHNAAYVSITSKFNDIQIRCRIIEQLFGNTLFDPEQPLCVNVVKLAEAKNEDISIVIANVESLSLQLIHELCQLAEIAKKLNKTINVLLLGTTQTVKNLSENSHLFENKISVLLAENGQLISLNSPHFKNKAGTFWSNNKLTVALFLLTLIIVLSLFITSGYFSQSKEIQRQDNNKEALLTDDYKKAFVNVSVADKNLKETEKLNIATVKEVFGSLVQQQDVNNSVSVGKATNIEIAVINPALQKITNTAEAKSALQATDNQVNLKSALPVPTLENKKDTIGDEAYYQDIATGYVIQLASFDRSDGFKDFIKDNKNTLLYGYTRNNKSILSYIVTTKVYETRAEAKTAINNLSQNLINRGAWIKSIQAVKNEIRLYQQSI